MLPFQIGKVTDTGKQRSVNEDALCALDLSDYAPSGEIDGLFAVADGMGGHAHGEQASNYVIRELSRLFGTGEYQNWIKTRHIDEQNLPLVFKEAVAEINQRVYEAAIRQNTQRRMGTTVTAALLSQDQLFISHVGDSRAYLIHDDVISQITRDHSWVNELVEQGVLTSEQAQHHQAKNIVTRSIGPDPSVQIDTHMLQVSPGDILFLCTDGLSNSIQMHEIQMTLQAHPPQKACKRLVHLANRRDGSDNASCLAVRFTENVPASSRQKRKRVWILLGILLAILGAVGIYFWML